MSEVITKISKTYRAEIKTIDEERHRVYALFNTSGRDRDNEENAPTAWKKRIAPFLSHNVLVSCHTYDDLRKQIGEVELNQTKLDEGLEGWVSYYVGEGNDEADWAWVLAKKNKAAFSVGYMPYDYRAGNGTKEPTRLFTDNELLEITQCIIPSYREALQNAKTSDLTVKSLIDEVLKMPELNTSPKAVTKAVDYNAELNRSQLQGAVWNMLDTFGMCVVRTCGDSTDKDKPTTLTTHGDAFYACYGKWIKDAKKAGLFDEQPASDSMMMSFRDYFTKAQPKAEKAGQTTIADEIDYLVTLCKEGGLSEENKLTLKRLAGSDIPVQILKSPEKDETKKESLKDYLRDEIKRQITEV
jgi:hypothetical protein